MQINVDKIVEEYINQTGSRTKENANQFYSYPNLKGHLLGYITADYALKHLFKEDLAVAHEKGILHINDLNSLCSYSYFGKECIQVKYKGQLLFLSFSQLYDLLEVSNEDFGVLSEEDDATAYYPKDLQVLDLVDGGEVYTNVTRVIKKKRNKYLHFLKTRNGFSQIVTSNHPVITKRGDVNAKDVVEGDIVTTVQPKLDGKVTEINVFDTIDNPQIYLLDGEFKPTGEKISKIASNGNMDNLLKLDNDLGWLFGLIIADGNTSGGKIVVYQNDNNVLAKAKKILNKLNIAYKQDKRTADGDCYVLNIKSPMFCDLYRKLFGVNKSETKHLPLDFLKYNSDFLNGLLCGIIDGDGCTREEQGNQYSRSVTIRMSTRTLLNQLSYILRANGVNSRERKPYFHEKSKTGFKSNLTMYSLFFTVPPNVFNGSVKCAEIENMQPINEKSANKFYSFGWGESEITQNLPVVLEADYVFDITTDTRHFLCNGILSHNCYGLDYIELLHQGLAGDDGSKPPKYFDTALGITETCIMKLSGQIAGAVAINSPDVLLAPYIKNEGLTYEQVRHELKQFVFRINTRVRASFEAPFVNFQLDITVPKRLKKVKPVIQGKKMEFTYEDCQEQIDMFNIALLDILEETNKPFPVVNMGIAKDFNWEGEVAKKIFTAIGTIGQPVISNYVNSDYDPDTTRSMCCFEGSQEFIVMEDNKEVVYSFLDAYTKFGKDNLLVRSGLTLDYSPAKMVRVKTKKSQAMFEITCLDENKNEYTLKTTDNHIHLVAGKGNRSTVELELGDKFYIEKDNVLDFVSIVEIEQLDEVPTYVYCVEMENKQLPYFNLANGVITHNCSLRLDMSKIMKGSSSFGANNGSGSIGVITLNLALIGYLGKGSKEKLFNTIRTYMDLAKEGLGRKRSFIESWHEIGMYPTLYQFSKDFSTLFSTIGVVGMNEMCLAFLGKGIDTEEGLCLCEEVADYMNNVLSEYQLQDEHWYDGRGVYWNLEVVPAEGATRRLAQQMKKYYPDSITSNGSQKDYITRGCWLPADKQYTLAYATEHQDRIQKKFSGGCNFNWYLEAPIKDPKAVKSLVSKFINNTSLPFISISPPIKICPVCNKRVDEYCEHDLSVEEIEKLGVEVIED